MEIAIWPYALVFSRFALITVFAVSTIGKLRHLSFFQKTILNFQILPNRVIKPASFLLVTGEVAIPILLLVGNSFWLIGYWLAILMLSIFNIALFYALRRGIQTSCGCFGSSEKPISFFEIGRNAGFILCALFGILSLKFPNTDLHALEWCLTAIMAIVLSVWIILYRELPNFSSLEYER